MTDSCQRCGMTAYQMAEYGPMRCVDLQPWASHTPFSNVARMWDSPTVRAAFGVEIKP